MGEAGEGGVVPRQIGASHISGEPVRARGERGVAQMSDQRRDGVLSQLAEIHTAGDGEGDKQDGVPERILLHPRPSRAVSSSKFWARMEAGSGAGTSGMDEPWQDLCGAARGEIRPRIIAKTEGKLKL